MKELQFLIKPASSACNLRCRYCFYADIAQNRSVGNMGMMQPETVDLLLIEAFTNIEANGSIHFAFQGGEPTVAGLPFFVDFVNKANRQKPKNVTVSYSIQVNGTLMDDQWVSFLKQHDFHTASQ